MKKIIIAAAMLLFTCAATLSAQDLPDNDWAQFKRYSQANSEVKVRPKAVLMGDSITARIPTFSLPIISSAVESADRLPPIC